MSSRDKFVDLTGIWFGKVEVLGFEGYRESAELWLCRCMCGNEVKRTFDQLQDIEYAENYQCRCPSRKKKVIMQPPLIEQTVPIPITLPRYLYLIQAGNTQYYKIGLALEPEYRVVRLQIGNHLKLRLVIAAKVRSEFEKKEKQIHEKFVQQHIRGEWFHLNKNELQTVKAMMRKLSRTDRKKVV